MILRRCRRAVALAWALSESLIRYAHARLRGPLTFERQARWAHEAAERVLWSMGVTVRVLGRPPTRGLLVANHLSYMDIAVLSAVTPCFFVARADLACWPLFGTLARCAGTLFLERASPASANAVAARMAERLALPVPVVLFPEGTSTDGREVLRFHSRLFHPATDIGAPVTPATLHYEVEDGLEGPVAEREVCFYGDQELASRIWHLLGLPRFSAYVRFGEMRIYPDARTAALETRAEIAAQRAGHVKTAP